MIYLASPYTHPDPFIREERYLRACKVLAEQYLAKKRWAYSPIVHCHELAKIVQLPREASFWGDYNHHMLTYSSALHVLRIDGWMESAGVEQEIKWADELGKPVEFI